jgi:ketosteroid isomerase-like protein
VRPAFAGWGILGLTSPEGSAIEQATRLYHVWNTEGVDGVARRFWAEGIEWRDDPSVPDAGTYRGREQVRRHINDRVEVLGHFQIDPEQVIEAGPDRVLVVYEVRGQAGQSEAPWTQRMAQSLRFEGERVIEVQDYLDVDRALAASGLRR